MSEPISAVIFDVGQVLYHWEPRLLYERLIDDDRALDAFLRDVVSMDWHCQHDMGRPFSETSAELIDRHPEHEALIRIWGERFIDSVQPAVAGMAQLVGELRGQGVALYGLTNFSAEFWESFHAREADFFANFRDILVSGAEGLVKPDPAIYRLALSRFGLRTEEAFFIDDRVENVAAAEALGIRSHLFRDAETLRRDLAAQGLLQLNPAL